MHLAMKEEAIPLGEVLQGKERFTCLIIVYVYASNHKDCMGPLEHSLEVERRFCIIIKSLLRKIHILEEASRVYTLAFSLTIPSMFRMAMRSVTLAILQFCISMIHDGHEGVKPQALSFTSTSMLLCHIKCILHSSLIILLVVLCIRENIYTLPEQRSVYLCSFTY